VAGEELAEPGLDLGTVDIAARQGLAVERLGRGVLRQAFARGGQRLQ
jgi:hypothetical protein